jgi:hypothetical protein
MPLRDRRDRYGAKIERHHQAAHGEHEHDAARMVRQRFAGCQSREAGLIRMARERIRVRSHMGAGRSRGHAIVARRLSQARLLELTHCVSVVAVPGSERVR